MKRTKVKIYKPKKTSTKSYIKMGFGLSYRKRDLDSKIGRR